MCNWTEDLQPDGEVAWQTECDNLHVFMCDGAAENGYNYCPFCGDVLHIKPSPTGDSGA